MPFSPEGCIVNMVKLFCTASKLAFFLCVYRLKSHLFVLSCQHVPTHKYSVADGNTAGICLTLGEKSHMWKKR